MESRLFSLPVHGIFQSRVSKRATGKSPELAGWKARPASPLQFLQSSRDFLRVGAAVEGADAEVSFALRTKAAAGRDDNVRVGEDFVEGAPARDALRCLHPKVRGVDAAKNFQARFLRAGAEHFGVAEVMFDQRA